MTPRPLPWMKPGDLILFDLEMLPWPAYLRMVEEFFAVRGQRLQLQRSQGNRAEYLMFETGASEPIAALLCLQSRKVIDRSELQRLLDRMQSQALSRGFLFSPGGIGSEVYSRAGDENVELYSGNKLRVRIESLRDDLRRQVMDAISAAPRQSPPDC